MKTQFKDFDRFFSAFLTAALWSSTPLGDPNSDEPCDSRFSPSDIEPESLDVLRAHALSFWSRVWYYLDADNTATPHNGDLAKQAGHDFWLTSAGHGAGFWDGQWLKYGDMFTKLAKCYPCEHICFSETGDGKLSIR